MPVSFSTIKETLLERLTHLDHHLIYHNIGHTLDVLEQCERIAWCERITNTEDLFLLKVAALYHDAGFLKTYRGHEAVSCRIFLEDAEKFDLNDQQKEIIQGLIMSTKVPQQPVGILQEIICDADLDYLAREDFYSISDNLRQEFIHFGIVANDMQWEELQLGFFGNHHYHTISSRNQREPAKQKHFAELLAHPAA
ncbi:MAG: HD domain-containing protein [Chitinophagaceae bacterium]